VVKSFFGAVLRGSIWLVRRGPAVIFLRLGLQAYRKITGHPVYRYSRITEGLYVGGQHRRHGWASMQAEGITAVLNLRRRDDVPRGVASNNYLHLPTPDNHPPTQYDLQRGVDFIRAQVEAGGKVYVHCGVGVGRAPTMAAVYLVSTGLSVDEAWRLLRHHRPIIFPLRGQTRAVKAFAANIADNE